MKNEVEHKEQISVLIDRDVRQDIERIAAEECRSISAQVRWWILNGLADHEAAGQSEAA